jgi:hypothetical protein
VTKLLKELLERVETWPESRQADVAEILKSMEEQDKSGLKLTDAQVAEVERRMANPNPKTLTLQELDKRLSRLGI